MKTICTTLVVLAIFLPASTGWAGTIYYYEGPDGVLHFTDLPLTPHYSPFVFWGDATGETKEKIQKLITKYASQYGVDGNLVQALAHVESRYDCKAVSRAGAQGVMQIMPGTQKDLGLTTP